MLWHLRSFPALVEPSYQATGRTPWIHETEHDGFRLLRGAAGGTQRAARGVAHSLLRGDRR
jgi:hypothetical protein